jgi:hypothetical protein
VTDRIDVDVDPKRRSDQGRWMMSDRRRRRDGKAIILKRGRRGDRRRKKAVKRNPKWDEEGRWDGGANDAICPAALSVHHRELILQYPECLVPLL